MLRLYPAAFGDFVDASPVRLEQARRGLAGYPDVRRLEADLERSALPGTCGGAR